MYIISNIFTALLPIYLFSEKSLGESEYSRVESELPVYPFLELDGVLREAQRDTWWMLRYGDLPSLINAVASLAEKNCFPRCFI